MAGGETPWKSKKGFGYTVRQARARSGNTAVRELLTDGRYIGAVLRDTKVGNVKEGALTRG